jgi:hypothetical protein
MESLAFLVAAIVATVLILGVVAAVLSAWGWRVAGGIVGVLAIVASGSLGWQVPQAWAIWLPPLVAGAWAFWRSRDP